MNSLLISPHNDDETLYAAFTVMREKPRVLIVTDGYIQGNRGDNITAQQRKDETVKALKILGATAVLWGGLRDDKLTREDIKNLFLQYRHWDEVFAPAVIDNGNEQHNLIGEVAKEVWPNLIAYMTYSKTNLMKIGRVEIEPTEEEIQLKNQALDCYVSQINLPATRPHFDAVRGRSEWYA